MTDDDNLDNKMNGGEPEAPRYNTQLAGMLEKYLAEVKAGRWVAGVLILAQPPYGVTMQICGPQELSLILNGGCDAAKAHLLGSAFTVQEPARPPLVRAQAIPPRPPLVG